MYLERTMLVQPLALSYMKDFIKEESKELHNQSLFILLFML